MEAYTSRGGGPRRKPFPRSRAAHAEVLERELEAAINRGDQQLFRRKTSVAQKGFYLEFDIPADQDFIVDKLEDRRQGIELVTVQPPAPNAKTVKATVFVPENAKQHFLKRVEQYRTEESPKGHRPRNEDLVTRIESVHLAKLQSLWSDQPGLFPRANETVWWEVWIREQSAEHFSSLCELLDIETPTVTLTFPERVVRLARADREKMAALVSEGDVIAEVRAARDRPEFFLTMGPVEQTAWVERLRARTIAPDPNSPAVCVLDTGINRAHPLLELALPTNALFAYEQAWGLSDNGGHGTAIAGLALYGNLSEILDGDERIDLQHGLESVKILPPPSNTPNDPQLYGEITRSCVEIVENTFPEKPRVHCLAITNVESQNLGRPTSWSAALDQLAIERGHRRVIFVSAGNIRHEIARTDYPNVNDASGVEDPAQSWNSITVGAFTNVSTVGDPEFDGWAILAQPGDLSPRARTSVSWEREWPLKPEVVMEGGNMAVNPSTNVAEPVRHLALVTTAHDFTIRPLRSFRDTSAATALAAGMGAEILSRYPQFWPETIRALVVHSAEWTPQMRARLNSLSKMQRENLVRRYGYGVPDLTRALWSAQSDLTLVVQDTIFPFYKDGSVIKTRDMHVHDLPWPTAVLQSLGDIPIQMRITLSYFIEPNPGERGRTRRTVILPMVFASTRNVLSNRFKSFGPGLTSRPLPRRMLQSEGAAFPMTVGTWVRCATRDQSTQTFGLGRQLHSPNVINSRYIPWAAGGKRIWVQSAGKTGWPTL